MINFVIKTHDFIKKTDKFANKNAWFYKKIINLLIKNGKV